MKQGIMQDATAANSPSGQENGAHGPGAPEKRMHRRSLVGVVTSASRAKTIGVTVQYSVKHRKYEKQIRRRTTMHAHDETRAAVEGDIVEIAECRPISKTKHWRLVRVLQKAAGRAPVQETTAAQIAAGPKA
jgi:small subunit ribosomal protein S17